MPAWKSDQSGNPSGRPRTKPISRYGYIAEEKLPESIRKKVKLEPSATCGDAVAVRTFYAALEGDIAVRSGRRSKASDRVTIGDDYTPQPKQPE